MERVHASSSKKGFMLRETRHEFIQQPIACRFVRVLEHFQQALRSLGIIRVYFQSRLKQTARGLYIALTFVPGIFPIPRCAL